MAIVEIQLNRLGINSLEISTDSVEVSVGTALHIRITNFGAPTHATLKTDGAAFTSFTYENMYVDSESEILVPILPTASPGAFDMQVICGYGMRRAAFTINVIQSEAAAAGAAVLGVDAQDNLLSAYANEKASSIEGKKGSPGLYIINLIAPVIGLIILLIWIFMPGLVSGLVMAVLLYLVMLVGIIVTWRTVR